jgi:hypothetical protein
MATLAGVRPGLDRDARFFFISAVVMTLVLVAGFSVHLALGRSSFDAPLALHVHALLFFGWTAYYLAQNTLVATGLVATHRRLGWLAAAWVPAMVIMGTYVTVELVQRGSVPFFFEPLYFLVMNPLTIVTFAGLTAAAVVLRRRTQWHRRLMLCGMALLTGPGFGRLLPLPFLIPYAGWAVFAAVMLFPLAGVIRDLRRGGTVHPAWGWGMGAIIAMQLAIEVGSSSALGVALYDRVTAGTAGAAIDPQAYPPMPPLL